LLRSIMIFIQRHKVETGHFLRLFWLVAALLAVGWAGSACAGAGEDVAQSTAVPTTALPTATPMAIPSLTPVAAPTAVPIYSYTIVNSYPHDPAAFTQGLAWAGDGILYEGTGLYGRSSLRRVGLETGEVELLLALAPEYFGEGIALYDDKIVQLTWQSRIGFVYDAATFQQLHTFSYATEGWGITYDGARLIMSDGSATLYFLDLETFAEIGRIEAHDSRGPVRWLNELEYVAGEVWANVWNTERIARIDPDTGQVTGWVDLTGLLSEAGRHQPVDVLNGIAYDAVNGRLFVTGKLWPTLFEIELSPPP
jgi:glutaminyl-peptide cyclotransferase